MAEQKTQTASFETGSAEMGAPLQVFGGLATTEDLNSMMRVFAAAADRPDLIPPSFLAYLVDFLQTSNIQIVSSQIVGTELLLTKATAVTASETTASTAFVDLATAGPSFPALRSGNYVFLIGAVAKISTAASSAFACLNINGTTPVDLDGIQTDNADLASCFAVSPQTLALDNNVVKLQYRVTGGTGTWKNRQLIALRYANL